MFRTLGEHTIEVFNLLVDGDRVVMIGRISSTVPDSWFGTGARGQVDYRVVILLQFAGDKIIRDERMYDNAAIMERLEKDRLDRELETAAEVQRALLSRTEHRSGFSLSAGNSVPCRSIGGDFFDFLDLPSGDLGIAIGDVSGKGPAAALLAAMIQGMLSAETASCDPPAAIVARINRQLAERQIQPRFATFLYGVLSKDGRFTYCNAGHNPPIIASANGIARLTHANLILGAFAHATFDQETITLERSDTLVLYTDGVSEATNPKGDYYGEDRLIAHLNALDPATQMRRIISEVRLFCSCGELSDDVTVTITRFTGAAD
jgi:sigma-B regulation protein RsbU (phosphoserine phosphatase)